MPNRLAQSTSPYLLQHKDNPVDWYPWGDEAFEKARAEQKPVFLSVGYSSCHWCHVMEHESFEDQQIAEILNEGYVAVKVDREERPDVDEAYMLAVQLSSGRGGWPMSIFMTPDKKPFFAGTYFPKEDRAQSPGFGTIITQIAKGWQARRAEFESASEEFSKALMDARSRKAPQTFSRVSSGLMDSVVQSLAADFDQEHGGFGGAPKFPPHSAIAFCLDYALHQPGSEELARNALAMSLLTLEGIALGGIHDQVGGGFHRYSTDQIWLLPHFEKMLYDNALLLANFARASQITIQSDEDLGRLFVRAMAGILSWLNEEMLGPNNLYYSAMDADSEGVEGKYYVWNVEEVRDLLQERVDGFIATFSMAPEGNFHDEAEGTLSGLNVLYALEPIPEAIGADLDVLKERRATRTKPALDDKQLISWNGLVLSGLAAAGELELGHRLATAILDAEDAFAKIPHLVAKGMPSGEAYLDDYAAVVIGLLDLAELAEIEGDNGLIETCVSNARRLASEMIARFYDHSDGGFFSTADSHEFLFGRTKPVFDQPVPSGNALAVQALVRLGDIDRAQRTLDSFVGWIESAPQATESLSMAALWLLQLGGSDAITPEAPPVAKSPEVSVALLNRELVADGNGNGKGTIVIDIPEGLHINSDHPAARWLEPTKVEIQPLQAKVFFPPSVDDQYRGRVEIEFSVDLPGRTTGADFEVTVSYQPCNESECLLPVERRLSGVLLKH